MSRFNLGALIIMTRHFACAALAMGMQPEAIPACLHMKQQLMTAIQALPLPANFLDQLIDELGGPSSVAEMTGRRGRVVRDDYGRAMYELRAKPDTAEMDSLNGKQCQVMFAAAYMTVANNCKGSK